jgi:hypothetical protein
MGDSISKHIFITHYNRYDETMTDQRVDNYCRGCEFPDLDFGVFQRETGDQYELFVRFSRTSDNKLFAEGFVPFTRSDSLKIRVHPYMDFTNWPRFPEICQLIETLEEDFAAQPHHNMLHECLKELTATIVAVHKGTSKVSLVAAQSNFGDKPNDPLSGIDNMGHHGFCTTRGKLSSHSHGQIETQLSYYHLGGMGGSCNENQSSDVELGMHFDTTVWHDQGDRRECHWDLDCECCLRETADY